MKDMKYNFDEESKMEYFYIRTEENQSVRTIEVKNNEDNLDLLLDFDI